MSHSAAREPTADLHRGGRAARDGTLLTTITARALNRATLARQLLLERERHDTVEAVRRVVALQAQEPASPYLALWNQMAGFDPHDLDRAFAAQRIVRAQLMRITLHAVSADDYPAFHEAMQATLRGARLGDRRFTSEGVSIEEVDALLPDLLAFAGSPRTNAEVGQWLAARFGSPKPRIWWALRQCGPFVHATTGGPWSFGPRPAYTAALEQGRPGDAAASMRTLVRRYLEGFGPATMQDVAQFGPLLRAPVRAALRAMRDELVEFTGPGGEMLVDVRAGALPDEDVPAPARLLPMWDSVLLAYADRSRLLPPAYRQLVVRSNGDVLPTLLVDGHVAGVWRAIEGRIEASTFHDLPDESWASLESEARSLLALLAGRDRRVYARYGHWWSTLPATTVRVLARG